MEARQGTNTKRKTSRMFSYSILDIKDDIDEVRSKKGLKNKKNREEKEMD